MSPSSSTNVVKIDTTAITSGTTARNEANTNTSTTSAPRPPSTASVSTPGPSLLPPLSCASASKPVTWIGAPPTVKPATARLAFRAATGFSPNSLASAPFG